MRLDPAHAEKLKAALASNEEGSFASFDIDFMLAAMARLTLWERGILTDALLRSATAKRPTIEQRALLAVFLAPATSEASDE